MTDIRNLLNQMEDEFDVIEDTADDEDDGDTFDEDEDPQPQRPKRLRLADRPIATRVRNGRREDLYWTELGGGQFVWRKRSDGPPRKLSDLPKVTAPKVATRQPADRRPTTPRPAKVKGTRVLRPRPCARCGEDFTPTANPGQRACSRRCANALNRARRKERQREASHLR